MPITSCETQSSADKEGGQTCGSLPLSLLWATTLTCSQTEGRGRKRQKDNDHELRTRSKCTRHLLASHRTSSLVHHRRRCSTANKRCKRGPLLSVLLPLTQPYDLCVKMLARKQSVKGGTEPILADYGPDESFNESADIDWVNKVGSCLLLRSCCIRWWSIIVAVY